MRIWEGVWGEGLIGARDPAGVRFKVSGGLGLGLDWGWGWGWGSGFGIRVWGSDRHRTRS